MLFYLDTNICITFLREGEKAKLIKRNILIATKWQVKIPAVVSAELMHGAYKSNNADNMNKVKRFLSSFDVIPFDYGASEAYGMIRLELERKGQIIGPNDLLIATTALSRNAILVTNNTKEFSRIDSLTLTDWTL